MTISARDNDIPASGELERLPASTFGSLVRFDSNDGAQYEGGDVQTAAPLRLRRYRCETCSDSGVTQTQEDNDHPNCATVCRACKGKMRDTALGADTQLDVFLIFHYTAPRDPNGKRDVEHAVTMADFYVRKVDPLRFDT